MNMVNLTHTLISLSEIVVTTIVFIGLVIAVYIVGRIAIRTILIDDIEFFIDFIPNNDNDVMDLKYDMVKKLSKLIGCNRIYHVNVHKCIHPDHYKLHIKCKLPSITNKNRLEFNIYQLMKTYSDEMKLISITREQ